jgi:hypothetical protein
MIAGMDHVHRKFLLTEGGLSHRLEMWAGLIRADEPRTDRRALISVFVTWVPILVFTKTLITTKRAGLYRYSTLATEYTSLFHRKWIVGPRSVDEMLLGTGDIQSLADLANSFSVIQKMDAVPMGSKTPIQLVSACLLPMTPLLLTMMPLEQIVKMLLKVAR